MTLHLVPIKRKDAAEACARWHRHNRPPVGDIFRVGIATESGELVCVGFGGRPVARHLDDGQTVEVTRVASDGTRNATSMAYGALTRAAFALGYRRVITYTQASEGGASLRAAGWHVIASRPPRRGWSTVSRPRDDAAYMSSARQGRHYRERDREGQGPLVFGYYRRAKGWSARRVVAQAVR